jgi:ribosome biogenesis protein BRX1
MSDSSDVDMMSGDEGYSQVKAKGGKKALLMKAQAQEETSEEEGDEDFELSSENEDDDVEMETESEEEDEKVVNWDRRVKQRVLVCASRGINNRCVESRFFFFF